MVKVMVMHTLARVFMSTASIKLLIVRMSAFAVNLASTVIILDNWSSGLSSLAAATADGGAGILYEHINSRLLKNEGIILTK